MTDIFKTLVWDNLVRAALAALYVSQPWLNVPPINWALNYLVPLFADHLYASAKLFINLEQIRFLNSVNQRDFETSSILLRDIAKEKGIDSQEYIDAHKKEVDAFSHLIKFRTFA